MSFRVRLTRDGEADLDRLFDFVLERELARDGGNLDLAEQALVAMRAGIATLKTSPFTCRKLLQREAKKISERVNPFDRALRRPAESPSAARA